MADEETVSFAPEGEFRQQVMRRFEELRRELAAWAPGADVQHVGSTAVAGSLTKGDLDVQVRVSPAQFAAVKQRLGEVYAVNSGGFVAEDAVSFEDYGRQPSVGIHVTVIGGSADAQWRFRDLLLASPALREAYDALKRRFHGGSMAEYRDAKEDFVSKVLLDVALRAPTPTDYEEIASWVADADACRRWAGPRVPFPFTAAQLPQLLAVADSVSYCLGPPGTAPYGFGQYWPRGAGSVHLGRIIVSPALRGRGFGRELCRKLSARAVEATGASAVTLLVYRDNAVASSLYADLGFLPIEAESGAEALFMRRPGTPTVGTGKKLGLK